MATVQIGARFNESKQQFEVQILPDATPPTALSGTRMGLLLKDVTDGQFNQEQFFGYYRKVINYVRDYNVLNDIAAGVYDAFNHLVVTIERDGTQTVQGVTGNIYTPIPVDSISIAIPVAAGWAKEGSTVYLDDIGKRLYEKFLEDFGKKV